jgi:ankyrin repeat protein
VFFLGLDAMLEKLPPIPENEPVSSQQISRDIRDITSNMFRLWDEDLSGTLSCRELEKGFLSLSIPVDARTIRDMIRAIDQDGDELLNEAEFATLLERLLSMPEMTCCGALRRRWEKDEAYRKTGDSNSLRFYSEQCGKHLEVKEVVNSFLYTVMQDPTVLDSMVPYRANCIFNMTSLKRMAQHDANTAKLDYGKLMQRWDTVHDSILESERALLHWACANSDNKGSVRMVRDLLAVNAAQARMTDYQGRLPLHVACANTSSHAPVIVKLLLDVYPEGAQALDADGNLPLHVCLSHNCSEHASGMVKRLLMSFPGAAHVPSGKTRSLAPVFREFPAEMAFTRIGPSSPEIILQLLCEAPEMFFMRDRLGCTLFHNFCWRIRGAAEHLDMQDNADNEMCAAKICDAMFCASKIFNPAAIQWRDSVDALPMHYATQSVGRHSRNLLRRLIYHHASAALCQDKFGHTPLHLATANNVGEKHQLDLGIEIVAGAPGALMIPNHDHQLPVHLAGAWILRAIFITNSKYNKFAIAISSALEIIMLAISVVVAIRQYQEHGSAAYATCFGIILLLRSTLFSIHDAKSPVQLAVGVKFQSLNLLLIWTQLFVPLLSVMQLANKLNGEDYTALLWMRRMQMVLTIFPIAITCTSSALILQERLEGLDACCLCCCIATLLIVEVEQESYRYGAV